MLQKITEYHADFVDQVRRAVAEHDVVVGGMAHGLKLRVPLCDHRLVELAMQVPSQRRLGVIVSKRILRRIGQHRLPPKIVRRGKLGFNAPLGVWMRRDLERIVREWLAPEVVARRGFLNEREVSRLVAEHRTGRRDHSAKLWALIMIEAWASARLDRAPN